MLDAATADQMWVPQVGEWNCHKGVQCKVPGQVVAVRHCMQGAVRRSSDIHSRSTPPAAQRVGGPCWPKHMSLTRTTHAPTHNVTVHAHSHALTDGQHGVAGTKVGWVNSHWREKHANSCSTCCAAASSDLEIDNAAAADTSAPAMVRGHASMLAHSSP